MSSMVYMPNATEADLKLLLSIVTKARRWTDDKQQPMEMWDGSDLAADEAACSPDCSPSHLVLWSINSATDSLHAITEMLWTRGEYIPNAFYPLMRTALVSATRALWILLPEDPAERCKRALGEALKEASSERQALIELSEIPSVGQMLERSPTELIAAVNKRIEQLSVRLEGQKPKGDTRMIRALAEQMSLHYGAPHADELVGKYMLMWHAFSGSVHGYSWQDQLATIVDKDTGTEIIGDFLQNLQHISSAVEDSLNLYRRRAGQLRKHHALS